MLLSPVVQGCDSTDVNPTTQVCAHPYWTVQNSIVPALDMASSVTIGTAILACWAVAYGFKKLRRAGD